MKSRNYHLIHAVNSTPMFMRMESANAYLPQIINLLTTPIPIESEENDTREEDDSRFYAVFEPLGVVEPFIEKNYYYDNPPFVLDGVLVIPIYDAIMQYDYCGSAGTTTIQSWYEAAKKNSKIKGVIELMNSGGGAVLGTRELSKYKLSYPKPTLTLIEGMGCSAAQYIACASKQIWATSDSCIVGSVGVMTSFKNYKKYYAKMGINVFELYSKTSPKKNEASRLASEGDMSAYTDGILFELDKTFMDFVKQTRPGVTQNVLDGADMLALQGIKEGLVDKIGTLQEAVFSITNNNDTTMKSKSLSQMLAKLSRDVAPEGFNPMEEISEEQEETEVTATVVEPPATATTQTQEEEEQQEDDTQAALIAEKDEEINRLRAEIAARKGAPRAVSTPKIPAKHVEATVTTKAEADSDDLPYFINK